MAYEVKNKLLHLKKTKQPKPKNNHPNKHTKILFMLCGIEHKTDHLESGNYEMTNS